MDSTLVGMQCEPFTMIVEVGKVREFARAANSTNSEYLEPWAPVSPPTFLASASFWMTPENSPTLQAKLNFDRLLNGGQEFVFHGPPPAAGTRLTGTGRIAEVYEKAGKRGGVLTFMVVVYDYVDDEGAPVAQVRSTIIETAQAVAS